MTIIDGKNTAAAIKEEIKAEVDQMIAAGMKRPHLAAVLVGHDGGSESYVKNKVIACEKCGFKSSLIRMEEDTTEEQLLDCIRQLNEDAMLTALSYSCRCPSTSTNSVSSTLSTTERTLTVFTR